MNYLYKGRIEKGNFRFYLERGQLITERHGILVWQ